MKIVSGIVILIVGIVFIGFLFSDVAIELGVVLFIVGIILMYSGYRILKS